MTLSNARKKWLIAAGSIAVVLIGGLAILMSRFEPYAKTWIVDALQDRYQSDVQVGTFHAALLPTPRAELTDVVFKFHRRSDIPPLFQIRRITISTGLSLLLGTPLRVSQVRLEGLQISVPQRGQGSQGQPSQGKAKASPRFVLSEVIADGALLRILSSRPDKVPLDFEIKKLTLEEAATDRPMAFRATLTNAKPPGLIESSGQFGPWNRDEPGASAVTGKYTFRNADLSVFNGISGILSSEGEYKGELNRIECNGTTDTPDFAVASGGKPVDLKTKFHAIVDGTNGNTTLDPVTATFLRTTMVAKGNVVGLTDRKGKQISLEVVANDARVEDVLRLAVKADKPMMTGPVSFQTSFVINPGPAPVVDRLDLDGRFGINAAQFTSNALQGKIEDLSHRAQGDPKAEDAERVASRFTGNFKLRNAKITFSKLSFNVPGALVLLSGSYGIHDGAVDFAGEARTDAKVSEMTTGVKSFLLKPVDLFFKKKGAGAVIPIKITGTRQEPKFGLRLGGGGK